MPFLWYRNDRQFKIILEIIIVAVNAHFYTLTKFWCFLSNDSSREFPSPVKMVCNKFMKADLNESGERIVESHDQSSLETKNSSLNKASKLIKNKTMSAKVKSRQSVLKDYVVLTECENTSTFRKSICKDMKDVRKSTEAKDTRQSSNFSEGCSVHQLTEFEETSELLQTKVLHGDQILKPTEFIGHLMYDEQW